MQTEKGHQRLARKVESRIPRNGPAPKELGAVVFRDDGFVALLGDPAPGGPGAVFKTFGDPLVSDGKVVFIAGISSVSRAQGNIVASDISGALEAVAQSGAMAPGTGDALFLTFKSTAIDGNSVGILAQLKPGTGKARVNATNDVGLWVKKGSGPLTLALREGQEIGLGKAIKTVVSLVGGNGSPGQGRGWLKDSGDGVQVLVHVTFVGQNSGNRSSAT